VERRAEGQADWMEIVGWGRAGLSVEIVVCVDGERRGRWGSEGGDAGVWNGNARRVDCCWELDDISMEACGDKSVVASYRERQEE